VLPCRILLVFAALLSGTQLRADEPTHRPVRIGFVGRGSPSTALRGVSQFWERLRELGYVEGRNLYVERRWAGDRIDKLPRLVADVLQHHVDLIVTYGTPTAIAAKNATQSIPIVAATMADPVRNGLVQSLAHPGGNLTGLSMGFGDGLSGNESSVAAAVAGLGITCTAILGCRTELASGALVRVLPEWHMGSVDVHAVFPAGRGTKAAARALADHMVEAFTK